MEGCWGKEEGTSAHGAEPEWCRDQEAASPPHPQEQMADLEVVKDGEGGNLVGIPVGREVVPHIAASVSEVKDSLYLQNCD